MLRVYEILENVDIQSEVRFVEYDSGVGERVELTRRAARFRYVQYMYVEDEILYIEVEEDE